MIDQGIFSRVIILLILITYLLTLYGYCKEKIDLGHYWDLKVKKRQVERLQSEISTGFWHRPYNFLMNGETYCRTLCQLEFNNFLQEVSC